MGQHPLATDIQDQNFTLPVSWDGNRHSGTVPTFTPPSGLSASESGGVITLNWTNGRADADTPIERSSNGTGGWSTIATKTPTTATHDDTPGSSGTYYYRVSHSLNGYTSAVSATASATISYVPPISDGDEKTVTITGAGSNVSAGNQSFLGGYNGVVESGPAGAMLRDHAPTGYGGLAQGPIFSSVDSLNGAQSLLNDRVNSQYQFGFRWDTGASRRVLLARFSYFLSNPNNTTGQLKLWRSCGEVGTGGGVGDGDTEDAYITFNGYNRWNVNSGPLNAASGSGLVAWTIPRSTSPRQSTWASGSFANGAEVWHFEEQWVTIEVCLTASTGAEVADGRVDVACYLEETGELISHMWAENVILSATSGRPQARYHVLQAYLGNGYDTACKLYLDRDVYFTYSDTTTIPKFIILGNASTFSACTIRTVCEFTSWVDNGATSDITFNVNQGRHSSLTGLYVYAMSAPGVPINSTGVALS
jgi:hypothetical protein